MSRCHIAKGLEWECGVHKKSNFLLIALAKPRSMRGASHHPAFMSNCLTISHTCLPCLPSGRVSPSAPGVT